MYERNFSSFPYKKSFLYCRAKRLLWSYHGYSSLHGRYIIVFLSLSRLLKILVGGAVYQSGVFGLAGMFQDHKYTSAVMAGQVWNFLF